MRKLAALFLASLVVAAPAARGQIAPVERPGPAPRAAPGRAEKPLRLGLVASPRREAELARIDPFRRHVAATLGRDVTVSTFEGEADLIGALAAGRLDYAPLTAIGFATAVRLCDCVEPLAAPRDEDRAPGWHAIVLARKGTGLERAEDLAGRRLAVAPETAVGTRRLPLLLLARAGLDGDRAPVLVETAGPEAALAALAEGRVEAAVVWSSLAGPREDGWSRGTLADFVTRGAGRAEDFTLVWSSPLLPYGPHTVRSALDEATKRQLREMLVQLDIDPQIYEAIERTHAGGFVRVGTPSYRPFVDLLTPRDAPDDRPPPPSDGSTPRG